MCWILPSFYFKSASFSLCSAFVMERTRSNLAWFYLANSYMYHEYHIIFLGSQCNTNPIISLLVLPIFPIFYEYIIYCYSICLIFFCYHKPLADISTDFGILFSLRYQYQCCRFLISTFVDLFIIIFNTVSGHVAFSLLWLQYSDTLQYCSYNFTCI